MSPQFSQSLELPHVSSSLYFSLTPFDTLAYITLSLLTRLSFSLREREFLSPWKNTTFLIDSVMSARTERPHWSLWAS